MRINYKSDFDFIVKLKDSEGKANAFPDCDWDAVFWTSSKVNAYQASYRAGEYTNCFREKDGSVHFVVNDHHLGVGTLKWEPHFQLPNNIYPDGVLDQFSKEPLDIELVDGMGDCSTTTEVEVTMPYIIKYEGQVDADVAELIESLKEDVDEALAQKQDMLTTSDDLRISSNSELSLTDKGKMSAFADLWDAACYEYGGYKPDEAEDPTKPFLLNGLWFSYEEALTIYNASDRTARYNSGSLYRGCRLKTVLPIRVYTHMLEASYMFNGCAAKVVSFKGPEYGSSVAINSGINMFNGCAALEEVLSTATFEILYSGQDTTNIFYNCKMLREIKFRSVASFDIHWSPLLSLATVQRFVTVSPTKLMTITVHNDVYAKLTGDTTNEAAAALTPEELAQWQQIVTDGLARNITFATV